MFCSTRSNFEFLKNIMSHANSDDMIRGFSKKGGDYTRLSDSAEKWVFEHMDEKSLKLRNFEEFHCLFTLGMSTVAMAIREFYEGTSEEKVRELFKKRVELLKYGATHGGGP